MKMKSLMFASVMLLGSMFSVAHSEEVGSVDTAFKLVGANHKIVVNVFDDGKVNVLVVMFLVQKQEVLKAL